MTINNFNKCLKLSKQVILFHQDNSASLNIELLTN